MTIFFFLVGLVFLDSGVRGNAQQLIAQLESDGKGFVALASVVMILLAAGISSTLRPVSKYMLILIFVVYFVRNSRNIMVGLEQTASATTTQPSPGAQAAQVSSAQSAAQSQTTSGSDSTIGVIQSGYDDLASAAQTLSQGYDSNLTQTINPAGTGVAKERDSINYGLGVVGQAAAIFSMF